LTCYLTSLPPCRCSENCRGSPSWWRWRRTRLRAAGPGIRIAHTRTRSVGSHHWHAGWIQRCVVLLRQTSFCPAAFTTSTKHGQGHGRVRYRRLQQQKCNLRRICAERCRSIDAQFGHVEGARSWWVESTRESDGRRGEHTGTSGILHQEAKAVETIDDRVGDQGAALSRSPLIRRLHSRYIFF
jgi:hypothetical protein